MNETRPSLEIFLDTCRTEFRYLVTEFGFQEFNGPKEEFANPFKVSYVRDDLEISIEGIHYGSAAMVLITDKKRRVIGVRNLDPKFNPFDKQSIKAQPRATGQTNEIVQEARLLLKLGRELLDGDFSVFERAFDRKSQAGAEYEKRRALGIAIQEAVAAYEEGKWQVVVDLLEPHEFSLSKKMAKMLAFARTHL